jgi:hypothetical protein
MPSGLPVLDHGGVRGLSAKDPSKCANGHELKVYESPEGHIVDCWEHRSNYRSNGLFVCKAKPILVADLLKFRHDVLALLKDWKDDWGTPTKPRTPKDAIAPNALRNMIAQLDRASGPPPAPTPKPCGRETCGHVKSKHEAWGTKRPGKCLEPGCECTVYLATGQEVLA